MQAQQDMEAVLASFRERILSGRALQIRGGGTKDWYGQVPSGDLLDTRALQRHHRL
jgi:glycolate oxidase FAD binding subunit